MSDSKVLQHDPLSETEKILRDEYYGRRATAATDVAASQVQRVRKKEKPTHYKVVCISMYLKDIESLEAKVAELKRRGFTKANKSQLIRYALSQLDVEKLTLPLDPLDS
jgi:hypothetical protein